MLLPLLAATAALLGGAALSLHTAARSMPVVQLLASALVAAVVFIHLIPEALAMAGVWAAAWAAAGFIVPEAAHRLAHADRDHRLALGVAWLGLLLHAVGDGIALALFSADEITQHHGHAHDDIVLVLALHRLPVGAWLAAEVARRASVRAAWGAVLAIAGATLLGAWGVGAADTAWVDAALGPITGLTTGVLLHVLAHRPHDHGHAHPG